MVGFLRCRPEFLFRQKGENLERGWPTPRAWERVSTMSGVIPEEDKDLLAGIVYGIVGNLAGIEFVEYHGLGIESENVRELMLDGKREIRIPEKVDRKYAFCSAVGYHVWRGNDSREQEELLNGFYRISLKLSTEKETENERRVMNFSKEMQWFRITGGLYGGEQPPYLPEFDRESSFSDSEIQTQYDDFQEILKNFQVFIDLREKEEPYYEYRNSLPQETNYVHFPIRDSDTPENPEQIHSLMHIIDRYLREGKKIYLHCHGGRGRTGIAAGCWLAYCRSLTGPEAVEELNRLFAHSLKGKAGLTCPETEKQKRFIMDYADWHQTGKGDKEWI